MCTEDQEPLTRVLDLTIRLPHVYGIRSYLELYPWLCTRALTVVPKHHGVSLGSHCGQISLISVVFSPWQTLASYKE